MVREFLNLNETRNMFLFVSKYIEENKDFLTQADKAIGDGDHGVGMARGFIAVREKIGSKNFNSIGEILSSIGTILLTTIGGAAGAIFGTLFRGASKNLREEDTFSVRILSSMLNDGLESVKQRGKAEPGNKTMVDSLEPAAIKSKELLTLPLKDALIAVSEAARIGAENTKGMIATIGKAKTLGERSLGHPDPGAISVCLILRSMMEYVLSL